MNSPQDKIVRHYEECLKKHGDTHLGVDWPNEDDAKLRYDVMLGLISEGSSREVSLLDFGCGTGEMLSHIQKSSRTNICYSGLDLSRDFVDVALAKYPQNQFYRLDILDPGADLPVFDYVCLNGVFTEKRTVEYGEMISYMEAVLTKLFAHCRIGIAFNVMSKHVDWERDELFHVPFDEMADLIQRAMGRHYLFRADYGLYEYTAYVYRNPKRM